MNAVPRSAADLLSLQAERRKLYAEIEAVPDDKDHDRKTDELCPRAWAITSNIMDADIPTVPAVLVQFREMMESSDGNDLSRDTTNGLIEKLSGAVGRLTPVGFTESDPLVALGANYEAVRLACFPPGGGPDITDEQHAEFKRCERRIIDTPATTFAGVVVRLRLVLEGLAPDSDRSTHDEALCRAVLEDIKRLALTAAGSVRATNIATLEAEMIRQRTIADSGLKDTALDHHAGKVFDLIREIARTPAGTLPDLAAQARTLEFVLVTWGSDWDGFQDFARVVREGAEQLAAQAQPEGGAS